MVVRDHEPRGVHDDPGTKRLRRGAALLRPSPEELAEDRIVKQGIARLPLDARGVDIDHAGRHPLDHGRERLLHHCPVNGRHPLGRLRLRATEGEAEQQGEEERAHGSIRLRRIRYRRAPCPAPSPQPLRDPSKEKGGRNRPEGYSRKRRPIRPLRPHAHAPGQNPCRAHRRRGQRTRSRPWARCRRSGNPPSSRDNSRPGGPCSGGRARRRACGP